MDNSFKITTEVKLEHSCLVYFLSEALSGCDWLQVDWDNNLWKRIPEDKRRGDSIEGKLADLLLNGDHFCLIEPEDDETSLTHTVTLESIIRGCETKEGQKFAERVFLSDEHDYYDANNLLQIILFGEIIYG